MTFPIYGKIIQKFQTTNQPIVTRYNCQIRPFLVPTNPLWGPPRTVLSRGRRLSSETPETRGDMAIRKDDAGEPLKEVNTEGFYRIYWDLFGFNGIYWNILIEIYWGLGFMMVKFREKHHFKKVNHRADWDINHSELLNYQRVSSIEVCEQCLQLELVVFPSFSMVGQQNSQFMNFDNHQYDDE